MSGIVNELGNLCAEFRSDKHPTRQKAAEQINQLLTSSKGEIVAALKKKRSSDGIFLNELFDSAVQAIFKHAIKLEESKESKSFNTLRNKNYLYSSIINQLVEINLEEKNILISKSSMLNAFVEGWNMRVVVKYFGLTFLNILERGIYKADEFIRQIKVNEFSRILSHLYEVNVDNDEVLRFGVLKAIVQSIELACLHVQISSDIIEYLPEVVAFASKAKTERQAESVIKLFYLYVSKFSVDYHYLISSEIQNILPLIIGFSNWKIKIEYKDMLFESIYLSIYSIYPLINEGNTNSFKVSLQSSWLLTLKKIKCIIENEIKEYNKYAKNINEKHFERFLKHAAAVIYVNHLNESSGTDNRSEPGEPLSKKKISNTDFLVCMMDLINIKEVKINEIWLAVTTELIKNYNVLSLGNFKSVLDLILCVCKNHLNGKTMMYIRKCLKSVLTYEEENLNSDFYKNIWEELFEHLSSDYTSEADIINEKHLIYQLLIDHGKLSYANCSNLIQIIVSNSALKRSQCLKTVRKILLNSRKLGLDKSASDIAQLIKWVNEINNSLNLIQNVVPVEPLLIAETSAIAVINFHADEDDMNEKCCHKTQKYIKMENSEMILYKYNIKLLSLANTCGKENKCPNSISDNTENKNMNCLFQSNYELLMRLTNYDTTKTTSAKDIIVDINSLHKIVTLMKCFIKYNIFNHVTYNQCPLIKRIGLYLSHLELQMKTNTPRDIPFPILSEILTGLYHTFETFTSNEVLLDYLECQHLEELISFAGSALNFGASLGLDNEDDNGIVITTFCLKLLATLCSTEYHYEDAFRYVQQYKFDIKIENELICQLIEIFCNQKKQRPEVAFWFVELLKTTFKLYHTDIKIIDQIISILPDIFKYIYKYDEPRQNMFVALISLLKIAIKKSYSSLVTSKLICAIKNITKTCRNIYKDNNYFNLCLSATKFLYTPSLDIQYETINYIISLMDWSTISDPAIDLPNHSEMCVQAYYQIDWKTSKLWEEYENNLDLKQNCVSVSTQLFLGVFIFSPYNKYQALEDLSYLCGSRSLSENDFSGLKMIPKFLKCQYSVLSKCHVKRLVESWIANNYSLQKFPFFLCSPQRIDFFKENIDSIKDILVLYSKESELKPLSNIVNTEIETQSILPFAYAINTIFHTKCKEVQKPEFARRFKTLTEAMIKKRVDLVNRKPDLKNILWKVYTELFLLLEDEDDASCWFPNIYPTGTKIWSNLSYKSLKKCLSYLDQQYSEQNDRPIFEMTFQRNPGHLVRLLKEIKIMFARSFFTSDRFKYLYIYYTAAFFIIHSMPMNEPRVDADDFHNAIYFVREILFFSLNILKEETGWALQMLSITFLQTVFICQCLSGYVGKHVLKTYFNEMTTSVAASCCNSKYEDIKVLTTRLLEELVVDNFNEFKDIIQNMDVFQNNRNFSKLNEFIIRKSNEKTDLPAVFSEFSNINRTNKEGYQALRKNISVMKRQLVEKKIEVNQIVKYLLDAIRKSNNVDISKEAIKCLGEIGSFKINQHSYYLPSITTTEDQELERLDYGVDNFIYDILGVLDELLLKTKDERQAALIDVIYCCINVMGDLETIEKYPFLSVFQSSKSEYSLSSFTEKQNIDWIKLIEPLVNLDYTKWMQQFMAKIFANYGWTYFEKLAEIDIEFAEVTFRPVFQLLLCSNKEQSFTGLVEFVNFFVSEFLKKFHNNESNNLTPDNIFMDKRVIIKILYISDYLRKHNEWNLPLNLLQLSEASNHCQAYFMSIMYLEMWSSQKLNETDPPERNKLILDKTFQKCAIEANKAIGCSDALLGILSPLDSRLEIFSLENNWNDILIEAESMNVDSVLLHSSLKRNGMFSLSNSLKSKIDYETSWRLGVWDTTPDRSWKANTLNDMESAFGSHHFNALKSLQFKEENNVFVSLENARECILQILKEISVECLQSINKYMDWLYQLQEIEDFCKIQFIADVPVQHVCEKLQLSLDMEFGGFFSKEKVLAHQVTILKTAGIRAQRKLDENLETNAIEHRLMKCIEEAKSAGEINLAKRNIAILRNTEIKNDQAKLKVLLEDADIYIQSGQHIVAKNILQHILTTPDYVYCLERVRALHLYGIFMMETNSETFSTVSEKYFEKSLPLFDRVKEKVQEKYPDKYKPEDIQNLEIKNKRDAFMLTARYADREYVQLNAYISSPEFQMRSKIVKENRDAAESVGKQSKDRDKLVGAANLKRFANLDEHEMQQLEQRKTVNLCLAIENYFRYSAIDENLSSSIIFRIIALWFSNKYNSDLRQKIVESIESVPHYKFICAISQITARLNSKCVEFVKVIKDILVRCAIEHPHHTLYQLYSLVFAFADSSSVNYQQNRVEIAKDIITRAKTKENSSCIKQMEYLFAALIDFANTAAPENKKSSMDLSEKLKRTKSLDAVHCPTIPLEISKNGSYKIISINKWDNTVSMVGGINAPKKILCHCSDGVTRPQLLKGKDDLRQDAVMQQVFNLINELLRNDLKAVERNLILRTYKVVPLSMRSGILEWCQNTIPIGVYLTGDGQGGAHKKYRPQDYTNLKCRKLSITHLKSGFDKRYQVYNHICENIKPVFRYFFFEKYLIPGIWFERRVAYTQSVATTSIVGYILGLGDRHTQNILIDQKTAELIHIDFGIAFEQGKIMPTPETVPFRLTRDIVDPMGISGTNGIFQKSCEVTMDILRQNHSVITTILEVLLYDPLYIWKVVSASTGNNEEENLTAQRALFVVRDKLEGKQSGLLGSASVEIHVQRLINEAVTSRNLCQLYPGWDPYL